MGRIPITAAERIAKKYGYKQVVIVARNPPNDGYITSYGTNRAHCAVAGRMAEGIRALEEGRARLVYVVNGTEGGIDGAHEEVEVSE